MDINGYIHVWISDLGHAMDASTDVWYQCLTSDTGIRINDYYLCLHWRRKHPVVTETVLCFPLLSLFFLFFFSTNLCSLLLFGNERNNWNFNAMRAEWSQFAIDYFRMSLIWSKSTKLQLLEITSKHCSEAVCTLLLRVAGTITDVACTSEQGIVNTLTSRHLPAPQC